MKCQRCLTDEVTYRVYTDALDIEVCFACAKAACRLGIAVEMLNSSETRNSDGFHEDMQRRSL
jgi:hypothetical protein